MHCPACGLYHPPSHSQCVSCGTKFNLSVEKPHGQFETNQIGYEKSGMIQHDIEVDSRINRHFLSKTFGITTAVVILLVVALITAFLLTRNSGDTGLLGKGERELAKGQYAFAVKTLETASVNSHDPKVYFELARAYIGVDQIDAAWGAIGQAQQLGQGVAACPELASDLANYYRQRGKWQQAAELLRPMATADIYGKKAELADLDALWGDECLQTGDLEQALKCWEEARSIGVGSRVFEADARLSTIYDRLASKYLAQNNNEKALEFLTKLNILAPNANNYERAADIYEHKGQLALAIDQLEKGSQLQGADIGLKRKLANVMVAYGKELLENGENDTGNGYLQKAKGIDDQIIMPSIVLSNVHINFDKTHKPGLSGQVTNLGKDRIDLLNLKIELWDVKNDNQLWSHEETVIDDYMPPLRELERKRFSSQAPIFIRENGTCEFRLFINGAFYKSYKIGKFDLESNVENTKPTTDDYKSNIDNLLESPVPKPKNDDLESIPKKEPGTSEDKTMKDLDL